MDAWAAALRSSHSSLPEADAPARSHVSGHQSPTRRDKHHHHHYHRHHHHRHHRHAHDSGRSSLVLSSASTLNDMFRHSSRQPGQPIAASKAGARQESAAAGDNDDAAASLAVQRRKPVSPEQVERETVRRKLRENELRESLHKLTDHALLSTRQLDDTYYSLLEHNGALRDLIQQLQALIAQSRTTVSEFDSQVKTLQEDLQSQVDAFDNFTAQEERIRDLEEKVKKGRQRAERLSQRLGGARERLKDVERADAERWARTSLRLRIIGGIVGAIIVLFIALIAFRRNGPNVLTKLRTTGAQSEGHVRGVGKRLKPPPIEEVLENLQSTTESSTQISDFPSSSARTHRDFDPIMKLFDEL